MLVKKACPGIDIYSRVIPEMQSRIADKIGSLLSPGAVKLLSNWFP